MTHRNSEDRGFEISSLVNFEKRPHSLSVSPNLFPEMIIGDMLYQHVDYLNISTENNVGLLSALKVGNFTLHPSAIVNYHHNALESRLEAMHNDLTLDYLDAGLGAEIMFNIRKFHASIYLPMKYRLFRLDNRIDGIITDKNRFRVEPSLNLTYKVNSNHNINASVALNYMTPSIETLYSGYILTSYRQLSAYDVAGLYEGMNQNYSLKYDFKNILSMSFAGAEVMWNRQSPEVLYGSYYDGIVQHTISRRTSENSNILSAKVHASQGFDWRRLKIGASVTYSQSATQPKGGERFPWLRTVTNKGTLDFTIPGGVTLTTSLYHYYNNFNYGDRSFLLLNAEAKYSIKRFSFTLSCDNLLNRKTYVYSNLPALTESRAIYNIRPRSILLKIRFRIF